MDTIKLSVGMPTKGEVCIETMMCLIYALQEAKCDVQLNFHKGTYIQDLRNNIVKDAIKNKADYLMFVDSDLTFPPDGIKKLLDHKKDIVGGMYNMKSLPLTNTIKIADKDGKRLDVDGAMVPEELFKCYAIPTGFMLIKLDAIKDMEFPFDFGREEDGQLIGEDVNFCIKAQQKGLEIWCDPTIKIGHIGSYLY